MTDPAVLGPWVRRFLLEYLVTERNLARNTQRSYRDTLCLLVPFVAHHSRKAIDQLAVTDVSADVVRLFLQDLEESRKCGIATRNQRLAAVHSLAHFIGLHSPEHIVWCGQLRAIPSKRAPRSSITYLEKSEMDGLLDAPDRSTDQGRRDHALLLFLYNTGARADEGRRPGSAIWRWPIRRGITPSFKSAERATSCAAARSGRKPLRNLYLLSRDVNRTNTCS